MSIDDPLSRKATLSGRTPAAQKIAVKPVMVSVTHTNGRSSSVKRRVQREDAVALFIRPPLMGHGIEETPHGDEQGACDEDARGRGRTIERIAENKVNRTSQAPASPTSTRTAITYACSQKSCNTLALP